MATSKVDTIAALIVTHLEQVTGLTAALGPIDNPQSHPFAMVRIDPGVDTQFLYPQSYSDRGFEVVILIEGTKSDVSNTIQTLWTHWTDNTRLAAMAAAGAWKFQPMTAEESYDYEKQTTVGMITFDMRVRYAPS